MNSFIRGRERGQTLFHFTGFCLHIRRDSGKRIVLGVSAEKSEAEIHWRTFLSSLKERGMAITSGAHEGIKKALTCVFTGAPRQRCQFHLQQNAMAYVPMLDMRSQVVSDIRQIFNSPNRLSAQGLLEATSKRYEKSAPKLSQWLLLNILECFTPLDRGIPLLSSIKRNGESLHQEEVGLGKRETENYFFTEKRLKH